MKTIPTDSRRLIWMSVTLICLIGVGCNSPVRSLALDCLDNPPPTFNRANDLLQPIGSVDSAPGRDSTSVFRSSPIAIQSYVGVLALEYSHTSIISARWIIDSAAAWILPPPGPVAYPSGKLTAIFKDLGEILESRYGKSDFGSSDGSSLHWNSGIYLHLDVSKGRIEVGRDFSGQNSDSFIWMNRFIARDNHLVSRLGMPLDRDIALSIISDTVLFLGQRFYKAVATRDTNFGIPGTVIYVLGTDNSPMSITWASYRRYSTSGNVDRLRDALISQFGQPDSVDAVDYVWWKRAKVGLSRTTPNLTMAFFSDQGNILMRGR